MGARSPARKRKSDEPQGVIALVKPKRIQTSWVEGRYQTIRNLLTVAFTGIYFLMPWVRWEGDGRAIFCIGTKNPRLHWT